MQHPEPSTSPSYLQSRVSAMARMLLDALTKARKSAGLSQAEVARMAGVNRMTLVRMEGSEASDPQLSTVLGTAALLGLEVQLVDPAYDPDPRKMVHRGLSWVRLKRDPSWDDTRRETALAKHWEAANKPTVTSEPVMKHLVPGYTQEQATAVATAVQWMGSDVGFAFLQEALTKAGYEVVRAPSRKK